MEKMWEKYDYLLFDLDNTLLDFSSVSKKAFFKLFEDKGFHVNDKVYNEYNAINSKYWHYFELHKINAHELRYNRFKEFLDFKKWQLDEVEISDTYLQNLVHFSHWLPSAEATWSKLKQTHELAIVTNGLSEVQNKRTAKHDLVAPLFISEELGYSKPNTAFFENVHESIGKPSKKSVLVIGDNPIADIKGANKFGFDTCFFNYKRLKRLPKEANYIIDSW